MNSTPATRILWFRRPSLKRSTVVISCLLSALLFLMHRTSLSTIVGERSALTGPRADLAFAYVRQLKDVVYDEYTVHNNSSSIFSIAFNSTVPYPASKAKNSFTHRASSSASAVTTLNISNEILPETVIARTPNMKIDNDRSTASSEATPISKQQRLRLNQLRHICSTLNTTRQPVSKKQLHRMMVDDKHRTLYCSIPKVGCTHWKRAILSMSTNDSYVSHLNSIHHEDDNYRNNGLRFLDEIPTEEIAPILNTYFKFMFVRDPLERIVSAYRDKFTHYNHYTKHFQRKYGRVMIKKFRQNATISSLKQGKDVRFEEFVKYLIDTNTNGRSDEFNPHWANYHTLCEPCRIHYNFIGKLETMQQDADFVLDTMLNRSAENTKKPVFGAAYKQHTTSVVEDFLAQLSAEQLTALKHVYTLDMQLFGYTHFGGSTHSL